jgi:hydroxyacylglutathione hydrolase
VTATVVVSVVDEGLGNSAYLVDLGDGRALAVDVPRDLRAVRAAAARHGLRATFGERAATAASVLERAGHTGAAVLTGGPPDWADATGLVLESTA